MENGLNDFSIHEAQLKRMMRERADQCIALIDHTKINRKSVITSLELGQIDVFITNDNTPDDFLARMKENYSSIKIIKAK